MKNQSLQPYLLSALMLAASLFGDAPQLKKLVLKGDEGRLGFSHLREEIEERFLGQPLTNETIADIKRCISDYYKDSGAPLANVSAPDQEITNGVLQIDIAESKLGEIHYCGNRWYKPSQLAKYIRQEKGECIDISRFSEDLAWMNRNPFRRSDAVFTPGKEPNTTDIELITWDRLPVRMYGGFDNRGNDGIGTERMFAGFNVGNFLRLDHRISYQYTCSLTFGSLNAHTARYDMPLPWRDEISVWYGYSTVHLKHIGSEFHSRGSSEQASGRYTFASQDGHVSDFTFGYDFKRTNNNLEFSETPVFSSKVVIGQFVAGYTYQSQPGCSVFYFNAELVGQPGGYWRHMKNSEYQTLRPYAINSYLYGKAAAEYTHRFVNKEISLYARAAGQYSSANLLPSEEFGIGGADTVRGYKERIANGDDGILGNFEFRWDLFSFVRKKLECPTCCESNEQIYDRRKLGDLFSFIAFFDYGYTHVHKTSPFEQTCAYLMSAGPGLRYVFDRYVNARLDWGIQLHKIEAESYGSRLHFSVIGSY